MRCLSSYYKELGEYSSLKAGDKVYAHYFNKALLLFCIGEEDITKGMNLLGAHVDSPRLDLKPNPLYEDSNIALLKTHYYGGVKKYQWVATPLAIHGVVKCFLVHEGNCRNSCVSRKNQKTQLSLSIQHKLRNLLL